MNKVNIAQCFDAFEEYWSPKIIAELNGQHVKLAKIKGPFEWHKHDHEDEMFMVFKGTLTMKLRDRDLILEPGELVVIPRGVEHMPLTEDEVHIMLFEPTSTRNTGEKETERSRDAEWLHTATT